MQIFDLKAMKAYSYEERNKNVFYSTREFKARIIELEPGGAMPVCQMDNYVIFYVITGTAMIEVNGEKTILAEGQCLITVPANISMQTEQGVKIMGIQITKNQAN
jgi:quercetin dioxygenase-like cupin family protein